MIDASDIIVEAVGLKKQFRVPGRARADRITAVNDVTLRVARGEVVGLVGESGSGKTTVGRMILRLIDPDAGCIRIDGTDITHLDAAAMRPFRKRMQMVFQDPFASLNRRMTVGQIIREPLEIHGAKNGRPRASLAEQTSSLLERVGLAPADSRKYPHEFSGGQRQRIGIARALAVEPSFLVADEPVSALDVSVQAQVLNLLADLRDDLGLSMLFIAHDLAVVRHISDRVLVMYLGRIVESAPASRLFSAPVHPYTEALLSSVPVARTGKRERVVLTGELPSPVNVPSGCVFRTRCPIAAPECAAGVPPLEEVAPGHLKACFRR